MAAGGICAGENETPSGEWGWGVSCNGCGRGWSKKLGFSKFGCARKRVLEGVIYQSYFFTSHILGDDGSR